MSEQPDPRITHSTIVAGPPDLVGGTIVAVDSVTINREEVHIPRPLPGVPEFVAVSEAEAKAEQLRTRLLSTLVDQGPAKWQPDTTLVVEMRSAAETAVTSAVVGLEAFAAHHVLRRIDPSTSKVSYHGEQFTPQELRDRYSLDELYKLVLPELLNTAKPSGKRWWQVFRRVQGLAALTRHAVYEPVERSGLSGQRTLAERFYTGEYVGVTEMLFACFEHFSPNWIPEPLKHLAEQANRGS